MEYSELELQLGAMYRYVTLLNQGSVPMSLVTIRGCVDVWSSHLLMETVLGPEGHPAARVMTI